MKSADHGLPTSRAKVGYLPGTLPDPASVRLLLGEARNATQNPPDGEGVNRRTDVPGTAHNEWGRIKACGTAAGHREKALRGYGKGGAGTVSVYRGTVAGVGYCKMLSVGGFGRFSVLLLKMVPMGSFLSGQRGRGVGYAFAPCEANERSTTTKIEANDYPMNPPSIVLSAITSMRSSRHE